jgi:hypothetical protein
VQRPERPLGETKRALQRPDEIGGRTRWMRSGETPGKSSFALLPAPARRLLDARRTSPPVSGHEKRLPEEARLDP